jgi:hypothetical protein
MGIDLMFIIVVFNTAPQEWEVIAFIADCRVLRGSLGSRFLVARTPTTSNTGRGVCTVQ